MIVLIDNYDSFVFNLARYFERLGQTTRVVRNDAIGPAGVRALSPDAIVISPGPCDPDKAGCSVEVVRKLHAEIPILGVCLGHQAIAAAFGGRIVRANEPVHGRVSQVFHKNEGILADLPNPFDACRYHSLVVEPQSLPEALRPTAWTADGLIMALEHCDRPVVGVQFHPEAILTQNGYELLAAFLRRAGLSTPEPAPTIMGESPPVDQPRVWPDAPVTF